MFRSDPDTPEGNNKNSDSEEMRGYNTLRRSPEAFDNSENGKANTTAWHALQTEEIFRKLITSSEGLTSEEAALRLEEYGKNILPARKPPGVAEIVLHQFKSPLIYILLIAGVISILLDDVKDAGFIFLVVVINAIIGTVQEWKAEQSASQLPTILKIMARVQREKTELKIPAEEIVPGDIVLLESGNRIPADLRFFMLQTLQLTNHSSQENLLPYKKLQMF